MNTNFIRKTRKTFIWARLSSLKPTRNIKPREKETVQQILLWWLTINRLWKLLYKSLYLKVVQSCKLFLFLSCYCCKGVFFARSVLPLIEKIAYFVLACFWCCSNYFCVCSTTLLPYLHNANLIFSRTIVNHNCYFINFDINPIKLTQKAIVGFWINIS